MIKTDLKKNLSFILYNREGAPRFYQVPRKSFYYYVTIPSIFSLVLICALLVFGLYFGRIRNMASQKDPETIEKLQLENEQINKELADISETNKELQNKLGLFNNFSHTSPTPDGKLAPTPQINPDILDTLAIFRAPLFNTQESYPAFNIEDSEAVVQGAKINFRFNIVNLSKETQKLSGHIFVIMRDDYGVYFYPNNIFEDNEIKINFNRGEVFATTKFRPVEASFPRPQQSSKFLFKIIIFSRTGSLIYKQVFPQDIKL